MKLSTRSRYGVRLMIYLGLNYGKEHVLLKDISAAEDISEKYLSQIIIPLKNVRLVNSFRGASGGYSLAKNPKDISVKDIVQVLEGKVSLVDCVDNPNGCSRLSQCVTRDLWCSLSKKILDTLSSITLEDLVKDYKKKNQNSIMYNI